MKRKPIVYILFGVLIASITLLSGITSAIARPASTPKPVDVNVERFSFQNLNHEDTDRIYYTDRFYLAMTWDASANGDQLHGGDYFDMALPDQMVFPSESTARDFNIYGEDGTTVIAKAHVEPGATGGGTVRVTFTNWVEGRRNVRGSIYLAAQFDTTKLKLDEKNTIHATVAGKVIEKTVDVAGPRDIQNEVLAKWGSPDANNPEAHWTVRINHDKQNLTGTKISDHLSGGTGSEKYIADSFILRKVEMNARGHVTRVLETVDTAGRLTISPDGRSYSVDVGDLNGDSYQLNYRTTYTRGTVLRNEVNLTSSEKNATKNTSVRTADSGGQGQGDLGGKIRIIKTSSEDDSLRLPGAVFEVERPDGTIFELTTGEDGTIVSGIIAPGTYKVREKSAPVGYEKSDKVYEVQVQGEGLEASVTVANDPVRTAVSVTKVWKGRIAESVTVHLYADGQDTGKTLTLSGVNAWKGSFGGLRKFAADGHEIAYTVTEDPVEGYDSEIAGDATEGFTVTNTLREVPKEDPEKPENQKKPDTKEPGSKKTPPVRTRGVPLKAAAIPRTGDEGTLMPAVLVGLTTLVVGASAVVMVRQK